MVNITNHAYERAKERLRWSPTVLDKMAEKAFHDGVRHSDTKGSLNRFITSIWFDYKNCNNIRIHGENMFFFAGETLITLYQLPNNFKKHIRLTRREL